MMRLALILALMVLSSPALAERVFVKAANGDAGHAWLFGSAWQGGVACWLVVPRHATLDNSGAVAPFTYTDAEGRSAESAVPIAIAEVEGGVEAAGGVDDLAFARPANLATGCTSRLGVPDYAYTGLMETVAEMQVWSMSPRSYGPFWVRLNRAQAGGDGGLLRLEAVDPEAGRTYLIKGISGSVATAQRAGEVLPFAMILQVDGDTGQARAIRFDRIRRAFGLVEAAARRVAADAQVAADGVPYLVQGFKAISRDGAPSALASDGACWEALPEGGQRTIDLVLSVDQGVERVAGLTLATGSCGDGEARVLVEQKVPSASSWTPAADCQTTPALADAPACRFDLGTPRELRLRIFASGPVSLDRLRLY